MSDTISTAFNVGMTCDGCKNAVLRVVGKFPGASATADVPTGRVVVSHPATISPDDLLAALKKWGDASGKLVERVD